VAKWPIVYPIATSGRRQSPIDLVPSKAKADPALRPLEISYSEGCVKSISNTGNSWKANVDDAKATLRGGALGDDTFRLIQFHAHWGSASGAKGSEHTVDGRMHDAEMHLVHWNTKYGLFSSAVTKPDGLAVIGVFLQVCGHGKTHVELDKLTSALEDIPYKNDQTKAGDHDVKPEKLLPDDLSYWHYSGSLTTPPLSESVLWHVLKEPIKISKKQIQDMTSMRTATRESDSYCTAVYNNFRPPVPSGANRKVTSFDSV